MSYIVYTRRRGEVFAALHAEKPKGIKAEQIGEQDEQRLHVAEVAPAHAHFPLDAIIMLYPMPRTDA